MTASDGLFALIHSLTSSEKRYFKLFTSLQAGKKNYVRLFDAIDAQEQYDEAALKEAFRGEPFIRQLHVAKNYLYRLILRSLRAYRAEGSTDARIRDLLDDARILHEKGLHQHCRRALAKARKLASEFERDTLLLDTLDLESLFLDDHDASEEAIDDLLRVRREILRRMENAYLFESLGNRISLELLGKGKPRETEVSDRLGRIVADPLLQCEDQALSTRALRCFYYIHSSVHHASGNREESRRYLRRRLEVLESRPEMLSENINDYVSTLTNLLVIHERSSDGPEEFDMLLGKMRALPALLKRHGVSNERLCYRIFNFSYGIELGHCYDVGELERGIELIEVVEEGIAKYRRYMTPLDRLRFYFTLTCIFLAKGEPARALEYLNRILALPEPPTRQFLYETIRLVELIVHFELGNTSLLEYRVKSIYRFLRGREHLYQFESIVLNYFRKIPGLRTKEEVIESFRRLHAELVPLAAMPLERNALSHFDFLAWLESQIEGIPLAEARRRNAAVQR